MRNVKALGHAFAPISYFPDRRGRLLRRAHALRMFLTATAVICLSGLTTAASAQTVTQLFSFACPTQQFGSCADGYSPNSLIQASDGNFYGAAQFTTQGFSVSHGGTLFKITPEGQFALLFTFSPDSSGKYADGDNPASALVEGNDGFIYGTVFEGGAHNEGVLFRISKTGAGFTLLHNFCSLASCADGSIPGSLILGDDGNLYGSTLAGGSGNSYCASIGGCGTLYRFNPSSKTLTTLFDFDGSAAVGAQPLGLMQGLDGNFYGVENRNVFKFTSAGKFTVLESFPLVNGFLPTFADSRLKQAANGNLYGALITYSVNQAQFYEISPSGTGFQEFPSLGTLAVDFAIGSIVEASDGNLWTAFIDTTHGNGRVIAFSPSNGTVAHSFSFSGSNGALPEAGVIQGADGKIYGTTTGGGTVANGHAASGTVWNLNAGLSPPPASIATFNPGSGSIGTPVLIRGNHLIGTTSVTFNGMSATFKVLNVNFISANVPAGATTGPIFIKNAGATTTSTSSFEVH